MQIWRPSIGACVLIPLLYSCMVGCGADKEDRITGTESDPASPALVELTIGEVVRQLDGTPTVLLLRPDGPAVLLPITDCESGVIYAKLHEVPFPRPMTHDLFKTMADSLAFSVAHVVLDAPEEASLTARIALKAPATTVAVPASVGDALAIAQRLLAPILGTAELLRQYTLSAAVDGGRAKRGLSASPAVQEPPVVAARKRTGRVVQPVEDPVPMRVLDVVQAVPGLAVLLIDGEERVIFSMGIDPCQAFAIYALLHAGDGAATPPHVLLHHLLEVSGAQMTHAGILGIEGYIFIGEIGLSFHGRAMAIDARPSDALALALRTDAPILMGRDLIEGFGEDPEPYRDLIDAQPPEE